MPVKTALYPPYPSTSSQTTYLLTTRRRIGRIYLSQALPHMDSHMAQRLHSQSVSLWLPSSSCPYSSFGFSSENRIVVHRKTGEHHTTTRNISPKPARVGTAIVLDLQGEPSSNLVTSPEGKVLDQSRTHYLSALKK